MLSEEEKAIEHNSFNTSSGNGEYKITFETNNKNNYLFMQELARLFIDRNYKPTEFERIKINNEYLQEDCNTLKERIEKQQAEIEKKDKIIEEMAKYMFNHIYNMTYVDTEQIKRKIEEIIQDFTNKVERN